MAKQYPATTHPFALPAESIIANSRLREPQSQAYAALMEYWKTSSKPALVQIPVGCGKTGLMAILPFGNCTTRALFVAPNLTIRSAIAAAIEPTSPACFWKRAHVARSTPHGPFSAVLDGPDAQLEDCAGSHFVVTNIQQIVASEDRWLLRFPSDFFDMILIDEGHHNAANSWRKLFARFPAAKVVSLTATPFRSDGQEVIGELIYRYTFTRGIAQGYIKQLHPLRVTPSQIYFTYRDDTKLHTLEEVLKLREEAWFRRGVALAPKCNWDIVRASVQKCLEIRRGTGFPHQIIATTCSIDHAQQVEELYRKMGMRVRQLHSALHRGKREEVLGELYGHRLDCIVQVEMLGEGFDHPPLSVAAVFRPFASLSPYVQFVGRIMRVLREGEPFHPDNQGWVVSHAGLHVDRHWSDFCQLDDADQEFFRNLVRSPRASQETLFDTAGEPQKRKRKRSAPGETKKYQPPPRALGERVLAGGSRAIPLRARTVPQPPIATAPIPPANRPPTQPQPARRGASEPTPPAGPAGSFKVIPIDAVGPQQRRRSLQNVLRLACKGAVAQLQSDLKLNPRGWNLFRRVRGVGPGSNYVTLTKLVHQRLNHTLGLAPGEKSKIDLEMTEQALLLLDEVVIQLRKDLRVDSDNSTG